MTTSWTNSEFARVATALLWPAARTNVVVAGYPFDILHQAWTLDAILQGLDEPTKARVLDLADRIAAKEIARWESVDCSAATTKVDGIELDSEKGLRANAIVLGEMRSRLADTIPFRVCPLARQGTAGGMSAAVEQGC